MLMSDLKMICFYVFCFVGYCQRCFLLARSGRKTDRHIINIRMFFKFFMFLICLCKAI
jgi:hypothetical protein